MKDWQSVKVLIVFDKKTICSIACGQTLGLVVGVACSLWYTCMYIGILVCSLVLVYLYIHWYTCMYIGIGILVCTLVYLYVHWYTCMYIGILVCTLVYLYVH